MFYKGKVALFWWHIYSNGKIRKLKYNHNYYIKTVLKS